MPPLSLGGWGGLLTVHAMDKTSLLLKARLSSLTSVDMAMDGVSQSGVVHI